MIFQVKLWDKITSGADGQASPGNIILLVIFLSLVVLGALFLLYRWRNSPEMKAKRLRRFWFNEVGSVNGLSSAELGFLWKVAREEGLEDPMEIYFRRSVFEGRIEATAATPDQISRIRSQLYYP
jgi:hypothetical protein